MKHLIYLLLLLFGLSNCASLKSARRAQKVAKAQAVLREYSAAIPPEQQLTDLLEANPALEGRTVRVVTKHDTIRVPGATVTVTLPAVSTPQSDNTLIDSLMRSAATQLHEKDSLAYVARLRAILAARPKLTRDTLVQTLGALTVRTWVDKQGVPHTTITSAPQKYGYEKTITETGPVVVRRELSAWEQVRLWLKNVAGLIIGVLVVIGGVWLFFFFKRQRDKPAT